MSDITEDFFRVGEHTKVLKTVFPNHQCFISDSEASYESNEIYAEIQFETIHRNCGFRPHTKIIGNRNTQFVPTLQTPLKILGSLTLDTCCLTKNFCEALGNIMNLSKLTILNCSVEADSILHIPPSVSHISLDFIDPFPIHLKFFSTHAPEELTLSMKNSFHLETPVSRVKQLHLLTNRQNFRLISKRFSGEPIKSEQVHVVTNFQFDYSKEISTCDILSVEESMENAAVLDGFSTDSLHFSEAAMVCMGFYLPKHIQAMFKISFSTYERVFNTFDQKRVFSKIPTWLEKSPSAKIL